MKTLVLDIETKPIRAAVWDIWNQNVGLNMIEDDWSIISWCAKWAGEKEVFYEDVRNETDVENDKQLLTNLVKMMDEADIIVGHNAKKFDVRKINARCLLNGITPPSPYKISDTMLIAKANFAFTSYKLEYLTDKLCKKKKMKHNKFPGYELWKQCLLGNVKAWEEMEKYNRMDVVSTEELYNILRPYNKIQANAGNMLGATKQVCPKCGSHHVKKRGYTYTSVSKFQRYQCTKCNGWSRSRVNETTKATRNTLLVNIM